MKLILLALITLNLRAAVIISPGVNLNNIVGPNKIVATDASGNPTALVIGTGLSFDGATTTLISTSSGGSTNGIQQLNGAGTNTTIVGGSFSAITNTDLTANKVLVSGATKIITNATTTTTEINLLSGVTTPTGSGALVLATSPTLVTPTLGVATASSINKVLLTAPATAAALTIADGKTLTANNSLTLSGTDSASVAFGGGGTAAYTANKLSDFAATTSLELLGIISDESGTGSLLFGTSPTIGTPTINSGTLVTPTIASFVNATHTHQSAAGGGTLDAAAIAAGTVATARLGSGSATASTFLRGDQTWATPAGGGDVSGPASAVDLEVTLFNGTTGKTIKANGGNFVQQAGLTNFSMKGNLSANGGIFTNTLTLGGNTVTTTANKLSAFAATTSSELAGVISDEQGSGALVFATSPTLTTPIIGVATATTVNKVALTAPATGSTLTIADGKTLTVSRTMTLTSAGENANITLPNATATIPATSDKLSVFAATSSSELAGVISDETGSGVLVFATSPALTTPNIGVATATTVNKVTLTAPATSATLTVADGKTLTATESTTLNRQSSTGLPVEFCIVMSDETTVLTTGTKAVWRAPYAFTVTETRASVTTASSSGLPTVDIKESGTTIFSTKLTIDANEKTSTTAATPPVISDTAIADDAEMTMNLDVAGTSTAGLKVWIKGYR